MSERIILDAHAVLSFLQGEPAARRVTDLLTRGEPWMTLVNLGEVAYIVERRHGKAVAGDVYSNLLAAERPGGVAIQWVPVDDALVRRAASLKAAGGLSYADCFAAAAAFILDCPVITGDPEFKTAEEAGIRVIWL